jgi:hypothetical protein
LREALVALLYLELRTWVNRLRFIVNDRKRLVTWVIFVAWLAFAQAGQIVFMVTGRASSRVLPTLYRDFAFTLLGAVPGLYVLLVGVVMGASKAAPADFSSPADARYLAGSPLSQRTVVLWLQMRKLINPRVVIGLFIGTAILAFYTIPPGAALILQLSVFAAFISVLGLQLPLFLARRKLPFLPWTLATWALVLGGLAAAAIGAAHGLGFHGFPPGWRVLATLPPGSLVAAGMGGDLRALAAMIVLATLSIGLAVFVAGDSYPELWEASRRRFTVVRAMRRGFISPMDVRRALREARGEPDSKQIRKAASVKGTRVPAGALTLVWKEWMALRRRRGGLGLIAALLAASLLGGIVAGLVIGSGPRGGGAVVGAVVGAVAVPIVLFSAYFRVSLATDMRNPLWWLSPAGLAERLAAWTLAGTLPYFVVIGAGVTAALLISEPASLALASLAALFALIWTMRTIALAVYVVIPSSLDMVGPGVAVRVIAIYVLTAPPLLSGLGPGLLSHNIVIGVACGTVVALAENIGLLVFATYRIQGNGLGFARAESR